MSAHMKDELSRVKQPDTTTPTEPVTRELSAPPIGATCTHPRMRCPNGTHGCGKACGHWWCPDCGLSWDEGM